MKKSSQIIKDITQDTQLSPNLGDKHKAGQDDYSIQSHQLISFSNKQLMNTGNKLMINENNQQVEENYQSTSVIGVALN